MTEIVFQNRVSGDALYWLNLSGDLPPGSQYTIGYYVVGSGIPGTLTLTQTWDTYPTGVYLFLNTTPTDMAVFESALSSYLRTIGSGVRFLWIANPDAPYPKWHSYRINARQKDGSWSVAALTQFGLVNYALIIGAGCPIVLNAEPTEGEPAGFAFRRADSQTGSLRFTSGSGAWSFNEQSGEVFLSFSGKTSGTFAFQIDLPTDADNPDATLEKLDAGLCYFINDAEFPDSDLLHRLRYPVLSPAINLKLYAVLDVIQPLESSRSFFSFTHTVGLSSTALDSCWRTVLGHRITLTPYQSGDNSVSSRLVFALSPLGKTALEQSPYYLTYHGPWQVQSQRLAAAGEEEGTILEPLERLMPGISGIEYMGIMDSGDHYLHFIPGQAAYAPSDFSQITRSSVKREPVALESLSGHATTSWIYLSASASESVYYYAQPDDSEFYHASPPQTKVVSMARVAANNDAEENPFLALLEVPAALLPAVSPDRFTPAEHAFPAVPYAGLSEKDLALYKHLELAALSPVRRDTIRGLPSGRRSSRQTLFESNGSMPTGVTPQGLLGEFSSDLLQWNSLTLAKSPRIIHSQPPEPIIQPLDFKHITGPLKSALQSNQMFLVLSDANAIVNAMEPYMSVTFRMTPDSFGEFKGATGPDGNPIPQDVIGAIESHGIVNTFYPDRDAYETALHGALSEAQYNTYLPLLLQYGAFADLTIEDWTFHVSPYHWDWSEDTANNTIVVFKYADRSLLDLAHDLSAWTWLGGAGGETGAPETQKRLADLLIAGVEAYENGQTEFENFAKIVTSSAWNGILFLNVPFDLKALPAQLQGLAAGVEKSAFFVHHIGINISPVHNDNGVLSLNNSSLFGLLHYEDITDLDYTGVDYDFKVLQLTVLFINSHIERFASQVEVQLNTLFGEDATLRYADHGNNIVLDGVYQQHDDKSSYVFVEQDENVFDMQSYVLSEVDVLQAQFYTLMPDDTAADDSQVHTRFVFSGTLRFHALEGFDVFSYGSEEGFTGGLTFSNLMLDMSFSQDAPDQRTFTFRADNLSIDPATSLSRPGSFVSHFPLIFEAFAQGGDEDTPGDLGYMSVSSPLNQGKMAYPWYGLVFKLDLGSLGALAANAGLSVRLMAAWSAEGETRNVYVGVSMPGSVSSQTRIPIEGILSLNFKKIEITVMEDGVDIPAVPPLPPPERKLPELVQPVVFDTDSAMPSGDSERVKLPTRRLADFAAAANTQYMLKFRGVSFNLLTLAFPPGNIDVYLFGNPETGDTSQLAWYAAYVESD